jgi:putative Holliday junction resolvase
MQDFMIPVSMPDFMYTDHMKYMGIDYGTKRIGIAVSDDGGTIAFPRVVIQNTPKLFAELLDIIKAESVEAIVVGKSMDQEGNRNIVMDDIDAFVEELEQLTNLKVHMEDERFTSHFLKSFDFTKSIEKPISRQRTNGKEKQYQDAQAAASILQRFLDKR